MKAFLNLVRALFPQWDFFDRVSYNFELHYRSSNTEVWKQFLFQQSRPQWGLLFNATTNMTLAQTHIVENFVHQVQELNGQNIENLSSFKMLQALLGDPQMQFKLVAVSGDEKIEVYAYEPN